VTVALNFISERTYYQTATLRSLIEVSLFFLGDLIIVAILCCSLRNVLHRPVSSHVLALLSALVLQALPLT
jgi:hypothetical protein